MKLFVSYARVDKPYCEQIVSTLEVHEVCYDQRANVGEPWWNEVLEQIRECQGFVYLLSPDSVKSEYCRKEFAYAQSLGKHLFPVLIHNRTPIPDSLKDIQYVDFSKGLTPESVKVLLNSIYLAERRGMPLRRPVYAGPASVAAPLIDTETVIEEAAEALEACEFDRAVFLLKHAQANGYKSRFIDLELVLKEAEALLEEQTSQREAEREYVPIVALVQRERTRQLGCKAFQAFREQFPDFDPENLNSLCATLMFPMLEWCYVPVGTVQLTHGGQPVSYHIEAFRMSKYPVTNAQYQVFADSPDGYADPQWWDFSPHARQWRSEHPEPLAPKFAWNDHPRANVCWYEAMAFCQWLSYQTGLRITLPTEQQWQWAAQGGDNRPYPWGDTFDRERCNTTLSKIRMTTPVGRYDGGVSPFGVYDMAGNVWEWCLNEEPGRHNGQSNHESYRAVRGGSFISAPERAETTFHFYFRPTYLYATIGFRVVCNLP